MSANEEMNQDHKGIEKRTQRRLAHTTKKRTNSCQKKKTNKDPDRHSVTDGEKGWGSGAWGWGSGLRGKTARRGDSVPQKKGEHATIGVGRKSRLKTRPEGRAKLQTLMRLGKKNSRMEMEKGRQKTLNRENKERKGKTKHSQLLGTGEESRAVKGHLAAEKTQGKRGEKTENKKKKKHYKKKWKN